MKYMKQFKEIGAKPFEIPKEEARLGLCGYWVENGSEVPAEPQERTLGRG